MPYYHTQVLPCHPAPPPPVTLLNAGGGHSPKVLPKESSGSIALTNQKRKATIRFVTGNPLKTLEISALLEEGGLDLPFHVETCDINLPELQEDPIKICIEKCRLAAEYTQGPVLVEDTSLCFGALRGMPGPYIKHFLETLGNDGLWKIVEPFEDRSAYAVCNVGFSAGPGHEVQVFSGQTHGSIVAPCPNDNGFGWDTIFKPRGFPCTFSGMTVSEKNRISHRSLALRQFQQWVRDNKDELTHLLAVDR